MGLSALLPIAVPLVARLVDRLIGGGKGPQKKASAVEIIKALVAQFAAPGVGLPGESEIGELVEAAVAALNKAEVLKGHATAIDANTDAELAQIGASMVSQGVALLARSGALRES
jgi:hypothetical protein